MFGAAGKFHRSRGVSDPYWANTSLLVHGDGANGSTSILDATGKNTLTAVGNAQISTAQSKFGGSSLAFDGSSDYVSMPNNSDLIIGAGDFTIEAWVYTTVSGVNQSIWCKGIVSTMFGFYLNPTNKLVLNTLSGAAAITSTNSVPQNTFVHVAASRIAGVTRLFINGVLEATAAISTDFSTTAAAYIGAYGSGGQDFFYGYIDDLRITKGVARYIANFNPPAAPFPNS